MQVSDQTLEFIKKWEGFRDKAYKCPGGVWTIGYGTTRINSLPVNEGDSITREKATELLKIQVQEFQRKVEGMVKVPLNPNQLSALVSFAYNLGANALLSSTLLRLLNAHRYEDAANEFGKWVYASSKVLPGLAARRLAEKNLFLKKWGD